MDLVNKSAAAFQNALDSCKSITKFSKVDLVSLGPGDGEIDARVLKILEKNQALGTYYGIDISFELLRIAIGTILRVNSLSRGFRIEAICGDFTKSSLPFNQNDNHDTPKLFSLTGFTLGNFNEKCLLEGLIQEMSPGDSLFVDARIHSVNFDEKSIHLSAQEKENLLNCYRQKKVDEFVFGPVEVATTAKAQDVDFDYEFCRSVTAVPQALNLVIFCKDLDTTLRISGQKIKYDRLDLACTSFYNYEALRTWFESLGFETLWCRKMNSLAFFLLRYC
jgi:hypothetical protein